MKTSLIAFVLATAVFFLGCGVSKKEGTSSLDARSPLASPQKPAAVEVGPKTTGLLMKQGKLLKMKEDGSADEVVAEVVLTNGTKVSKEGKILFPDGTKMTLPEGSSLQMDGQVQGNDPLMPDEETVKGFQMKEGKVMTVMKDDKSLPMANYMKLKNGTVVETDGTLVMKDGTRSNLKEGGMILVNGEIGK
jgi:hypothetical protein